MSNKKCIALALLAALLYALNAPFSKLLLETLPETMTAGLLYLGAGIGMAMVGGVRRLARREGGEASLSRSELPYVLAMIVLDVAAPIFLMPGLARTSAASASLINNFDIVATSMIAFIFFREMISGRVWAAISVITLSCMLLMAEDVILGGETLKFSYGSLTAAVISCERFETKMLTAALLALLLGFVAFGLSIFFYVSAQRGLGAAKTSAYYAVAPFVGSAIALVLYRQMPTWLFAAALILMVIGTVLASEGERSAENSTIRKEVSRQ